MLLANYTRFYSLAHTFRLYVQVIREKADTQKTIDNLVKAIEDKEIFIKVAQTRLQERSQRLGCENCHDKPMIGLVDYTVAYVHIGIVSRPFEA